MRAQMFEKKLMPGGILTSHAWDSRLTSTTEDSGSLISPIVLRDLPKVTTTLQQAIRQWHRQEPFLNGLRTASSWVYLQLERYPRLHHRHSQAVTWERNSIQMPFFDGCTHSSVSWIEFQIVAGILHIGRTPVDGHYQAILFNSGQAFCVTTTESRQDWFEIRPSTRTFTCFGLLQCRRFEPNTEDPFRSQ